MLADMKQTTLVAELKLMLGGDVIAKFTAAADADFTRHLDIAAADFTRKIQRVLKAELTLVSDQLNYSAPDDLLKFSHSIWGKKERKTRKPWDSNFPQQLPTVSVVAAAGESRELHLDPAPDAELITDLGETFPYYYFAKHTISDNADETTIKLEHGYVLLIRAMAAAMSELASWGVTKPFATGQSPSISMPKNGTPAALADFFLKQFEAMAV